MEFRKQKPIYLQIADRLMEQILQGEPAEDDRMPSVRDVAASMGVNPNTVMRTFEQLQSEEIIYNRRGVGYFVSPDAKNKILAEQRREFLEEELPLIRQKMQMLGIDFKQLNEISEMVNIYYDINNNIINSYEMKNRNYQILQNIKWHL